MRDHVLPHDLDDIYGPGAEAADSDHRSEYHKGLQDKFLLRLVDIKAFIRAYWEREHHSPSIAEIQTEFKTSTSVVARWLHRLEADGWIEPRKKEVARNIVPVEIFLGRDVFPKSELQEEISLMLNYFLELGKNCEIVSQKPMTSFGNIPVILDPLHDPDTITIRPRQEKP